MFCRAVSVLRDIDPELVAATHKVAGSLKGDRNKTAQDLLSKLNEQESVTQDQKAAKPSVK